MLGNGHHRLAARAARATTLTNFPFSVSRRSCQCQRGERLTRDANPAAVGAGAHRRSRFARADAHRHGSSHDARCRNPSPPRGVAGTRVALSGRVSNPPGAVVARVARWRRRCASMRQDVRHATGVRKEGDAAHRAPAARSGATTAGRLRCVADGATSLAISDLVTTSRGLSTRHASAVSTHSLARRVYIFSQRYSPSRASAVRMCSVSQRSR